MIERLAGTAPVTTLTEPTFALDVLCAAGTDTTPQWSGRSSTSFADASAPRHRRRGRRHRRSPCPRRSTSTSEAHWPCWPAAASTPTGPGPGAWSPSTDRSPASISGGDLTDLIAEHVLARRGDDERRRSGRSAEENAVGAFRHLWSYLVDKGYATDNIAARLRKPTQTEAAPARLPARRSRPVAPTRPLRHRPAARRDHADTPRTPRPAAHRTRSDTDQRHQLHQTDH